MTGNRVTLWDSPKEIGLDVQKALVEFHEKYYSSNIMSLVIAGQQSLDELQCLVEKIFLQVPNRNATIPSWTETPFTEEFIKTKIEIVPITEIRTLIIDFPISYQLAVDYKTSVC